MLPFGSSRAMEGRSSRSLSTFGKYCQTICPFQSTSMMRPGFSYAAIKIFPARVGCASDGYATFDSVTTRTTLPYKSISLTRRLIASVMSKFPFGSIATPLGLASNPVSFLHCPVLPICAMIFLAGEMISTRQLRTSATSVRPSGRRSALSGVLRCVRLLDAADNLGFFAQLDRAKRRGALVEHNRAFVESDFRDAAFDRRQAWRRRRRQCRRGSTHSYRSTCPTRRRAAPSAGTRLASVESASAKSRLAKIICGLKM